MPTIVQDSAPNNIPKIALWPTIAKGYASVFGDLGLFVRVGWAWAAIAYAAQFAAGIFAVRYWGAVAQFLALTAFAVLWHRAILLDERPGGFIHLRIGREEIRYFLLGLLLTVLILAPAVAMRQWAMAYAPHASGAAAALFALAMLATLAAMLLLVARLTLVYPATAIGEFALGFRRSWRLTRGNTLRLLGGAIIATLPWTVVAMTLNALVKTLAVDRGAVAVAAALLAVEMLVSFVQIGVCAAFLSYAYEIIVPCDGKGAPAGGG